PEIQGVRFGPGDAVAEKRFRFHFDDVGDSPEVRSARAEPQLAPGVGEAFEVHAVALERLADVVAENRAALQPWSQAAAADPVPADPSGRGIDGHFENAHPGRLMVALFLADAMGSGDVVALTAGIDRDALDVDFHFLFASRRTQERDGG